MYKWNEFGKLVNSEQLIEYMCREYLHQNYYHYTSLAVIDSILKNNSIWVSNVSGMNDLADVKQFGSNQFLYYTLCFSTGVNENLPLWYLYSGIDGQGGRICFSKNNVKSMIQNSKYVLKIIDENKKLLEGEENKVILKPSDYDIRFGDILYVKEPEKGNVSLKYNTMTNYNMSREIFADYKKKRVGFIKGLIWYYEKETRIVIKLKGDAAKFAQRNAEKGLRCVIVLSFDDKIKRNTGITIAPECESSIPILIEKYPCLGKFMLETSKVSESEYAGQIKIKDKLKKQ